MTLGWALVWVSPRPSASSVGEAWSDAEFLRARRLTDLDEDPYPVFLGPDGALDGLLLRFATVGDLGELARSTRETYATETRVWLDFLWLAKGKADWRDASEQDFKDYEFFKRRDRRRLTEPPVGGRTKKLLQGASWAKIAAAIASLYDWATVEKLVVSNPVQRRMVSRSRRVQRTGRRVGRGVLAQAPSNARRSDVQWLTRRAVERWRQIGFEDYGADGLPREIERVRTSARNVAFVDLLYGTGLRRREGGGLLVTEVPRDEGTEAMLHGWVAEELGKGAKGRWFYLERRHVRSVHSYIRFQRQAAVQRARSRGRYEDVSDLLLVKAVRGSGRQASLKLVDVSQGGGAAAWESVNDLTVEDRMRLYRQVKCNGKTGLEPMWLWLAEDGLPLPHREWNGIFDAANTRLVREGVELKATPHMLRHSYALHMLIQAQHAYLMRVGLTADERIRYQRLFGNVWELVRDLLGHASIETTKNWYLAPVRGLQIETMLRTLAQDSPVRDIDSLESLISRVSGLVQDAPGEGG